MIGRKIGMTTIFNDAGDQIVCTVLEVTPNLVTQVKTEDTDGYNAVQLGFGEKKAKHTTKALQGHFEAAGVSPQRKLKEFRDADIDVSLGDEVTIGNLFEEGEVVDVAGTSKGKGFQGVVKRHGFSGVGMATHGQHNRQRAPGAIGAGSDPSRVFKGMRMAGRMGNDRVTVKNLRVVKIYDEQNLLLVSGPVPGAKQGLVEILKKG